MATKKYIAIGFVDRLFNPLHRVKVTINRNLRQELARTDSLDESTGRIVTQTSFCDVPKNPFEKFKVSDFSIENLKAVGALDKLNNVKLAYSSLKSVDKLESSINNLKNI